MTREKLICYWCNKPISRWFSVYVTGNVSGRTWHMRHRPTPVEGNKIYMPPER